MCFLLFFYSGYLLLAIVKRSTKGLRKMIQINRVYKVPAKGDIVSIEGRPAEFVKACDRCLKLVELYAIAQRITEQSFADSWRNNDVTEEEEDRLFDSIDKIAELENEECSCEYAYLLPLSNRGVTNGR